MEKSKLAEQFINRMTRYTITWLRYNNYLKTVKTLENVEQLKKWVYNKIKNIPSHQPADSLVKGLKLVKWDLVFHAVTTLMVLLFLIPSVEAKTRYVITIKETSPMKADTSSVKPEKSVRSGAGPLHSTGSGSSRKTLAPTAALSKGKEEGATRATLENKILELFGKDGPVALAVAKAESGLRCNALGDTQLTPSSYGVFQIRAFATRPPIEDLYDCHKNIEYAYQMYKRQGFQPWSAFTSGSYKKFLFY